MPKKETASQPLLARADFMRKEGTALFNELSATALRDVILSPDPKMLSFVACDKIRSGLYDTTTDITESILLRHRNTVTERRLTFSQAIQSYARTDPAQLTHDAFAVLAKLDQYTHFGNINLLMREAYTAIVSFPFNILRQARHDARKAKLPPVYASYEDIIAIYRAPWFQDVCVSGALARNGFWGRFSTTHSDARATILGTQEYGYDFLPAGDKTVFTFDEITTKAMRASMQRTNKSARNRLTGDPRFPERSINGSTSGCPVAHNKAPFRLDDPTDQLRLKGVAEILQKDPKELVVSGKNGIVSGLEAMADMFESCLPYIVEAREQRAKRKEQAHA